MNTDQYQQLLEKYKQRVQAEFGAKPSSSPKITSKEYSEFKEELYPAHYSWYEKACNLSEHILKLKADPKKAILMQKNLDICHLNVTPAGVTAFAILAALFIIVFGSLISFAIPILLGLEPMTFLVIFCTIAGMLVFMALQKTSNL